MGDAVAEIGIQGKPYPHLQAAALAEILPLLRQVQVFHHFHNGIHGQVTEIQGVPRSGHLFYDGGMVQGVCR